MSAITAGVREFLDFCDHDWSARAQVERRSLQDEIDAVPKRFGLRGFPGEEFKVVASQSFYSDLYGVQLYTFRKDGDTWLAFVKGSPTELKRQITSLPGMSSFDMYKIADYSRS